MRWIILVCLVACANPHRGNGDDDDDGSNGSDGSGSNGGSGSHSDSCGGLSRPWLATGQQPNGVVSGDFDRDGILDLAVSNGLDGTVSVMRGLGGGRFAPKADYPVSAGTSGLAVADFDRDGKLDVLVGANYGPKLLAGNDDGSLQAAASTFSMPQPPTAVAAGDFDGDGNPDGVAAGTNLVIARGNGDRTFAAPNTYALDGAAVSVVAIDVNGDGKLDVVVAGWRYVDVFLGHGDGTLDGKLSNTNLSTTGYVGVGDVTADGIPDFVMNGVATSMGSSVAIYPGTGNGSLGTPVMIPIQGHALTYAAVIDVDHDGQLDIAAGEEQALHLYRNLGGGSWAQPVDYIGPETLSAWTAADLDGDGKPDLAVTGKDADVLALMFGIGDRFAGPQHFTTADGAKQIALVDVDGDHHLDAAVLATTANTLSVLLGNGDGTFAAKRDGATGVSPTGFTVSDFDGDGHPDFAVASTTTVDVLRGRGDGSVFPKTNVAMTPAAGVVAADFNSDGMPDLVTVGGGEVFIPNAGNGTFLTSPAGMPSDGFELDRLSAPDLDGNGTPDLILTPSGCHGLVTYAGNGAGRFQQLQTLAIPGCAHSVATADLDGDGKLDLVVASYATQAATTGPVYVFQGVGGGMFSTPAVAYPADTFPQHVQIADVNGDGVLDIVVAGYATEVLYGTGHGTFGPRTPYPGNYGGDIALGDVDGDGSTDLVTASGSAITVLLGRCH